MPAPSGRCGCSGCRRSSNRWPDAYAAEDTLDEFIVTNFPDQGAQLRQAQADTATLNQRLAQVQAAVGTVPPSFYVPTAADGTPYPFTVRCAGAMGDVVLTLPLVFLRDEVLPAGDHLDALAFTARPGHLARPSRHAGRA